MTAGRLKVWNYVTGQWEYVSPGLMGPTGPAGTNGSQGATGPVGATGASSGGDVVGPSGSTDNVIPAFNGTTGKLLKQSGIKVDGNYIMKNGGSFVGLSSEDGSEGIYVYENETRVYKDFSNHGSVVGAAGAMTLTNKHIMPRTLGNNSFATISPDILYYDRYTMTALAVNLTINAPTSGGGTPTDGEKLMFRFKDNGTSRTLTWNAIYRAIGVTLPTSTTVNKTVYIGCVYNSAATKWDVIAVGQEA